MAPRRTTRILLVDSDTSMLDLLRITLKGLGYRLESVVDGREAMQAVQQQWPDLIIMELVLPVVDGVSLLRWLREQHGMEIPVLVLTALDRPGIYDIVHELGVSGLVYKPVRRSQLLRQVEKLVGNSRAAVTASAD
jgi:two-component system alkaline phosphatase synthesis response regulator PhoP